MNVEAVANIVARFGGLMLSNPLVREVDINPVVVYPASEGAVALDALIVTE
jgi:acetate---CoA ligase (ADP-forming)